MATPMKWQPETPENCSICQVSDTNNRAMLPCGHSFHCDCISQWASTCLDNGGNVSCPNCRAALTSDDAFVAALVADNY